MSDTKDMRKMVAANLRSVTQSCKGGVPFESLERDYRDLLGVPIPYRALGYSSLEAMIKAMPDVVTLHRNAAGKIIVKAVPDDTTAHIASLIARQKSAKKPIRRPRRPDRVRRAPAASSRAVPVRHFNRGIRAPPSYMGTIAESRSPQRSLEPQFDEVSRTIPIQHVPEQIHSPKAKGTHPANFGPKYEVPPRFLRKQERPLSSLENNSIADNFSSSTTSSYNTAVSSYNSQQSVACESTFSSSGRDVYYSPSVTSRSDQIYGAEPRSAREFVENYARKNNLRCSYHTAPIGQKRKSYVSVLTLGDGKHRSYPEVKPTVEEAEESAAEKARQAILEAEGHRNSLPVTSIERDGSNCMLNRIELIVAEKPQGIWNFCIPVEYEQKFQERLPDEWFALVTKYCSFYFEKVDDSRIILYPTSDSGRASPTSTCSNQDDDENSVEDLEKRIPRLSITVPVLQLPENDIFDVLVTNVQDAQYVAVRLLDYAETFADLSERMKAFYTQNKYPVSSVSYDKAYAVFAYNIWHRALVEDINGDTVTCHLVDEGDLVEVKMSSLQEMDPSFFTLPFQAVTFRLAELDRYSAFVKPSTLRDYLFGKSLIAKVVDPERTSIVLYDTSTADDINLNRIIFEKTVAESLNYALPECGSTSVAYLSHVSPCGTVYLTFNSPSTTNLLLEELSRITPVCEERAKLGCDISKSCIYCAKYESDPIWYRAIIIDTAVEKNEVEVFYVDYGNTSWMSISFICELKPVSEYLAQLPFQAVPCNLSELPPPNLYWSDTATQKVAELAPYDKELIVRVQKQGNEKELPQVALFVRNEQSQIVSINQTLAFNEELFSPEPSVKRNRLPSWTHELLSVFNTTDYTPLPSSSYRDHSAFPPVEENATIEQESLSNLIPDVAVSAEQQLAKRQGNWPITTPAIVNETDSEDEQFPPLYPTNIPEKGHVFNIFVTMAANPFNFMCQPLDSSKDLDELFSEMQSFYSNEENLCEMHSILVRKGEFFAGKHIDGYWYRVRKQSIVSEDPLEVSVYYVDYGDMCILPLPSLQPLFKQFRSLPCQCIKASLKGIKPNGLDWDPMGCYEFKKMVEEKQFASFVENKSLKAEDHLTVYCLELILVDVSDPNDDVLIHEELIKNQIAIPADK